MNFLTTILLAGISVMVNGKTLTPVPFTDYSYVRVYEELPVEVRLEGDIDSKSIDLSPHSKKVKISRAKNQASFTITQKGYYMALIGNERVYFFAEDKAKCQDGAVDVKSFDGICSDGSKNTTKALQDAVSSAAQSGKKLVITQGTYLCDALTIPSGADIFLDEGARIKADTSFSYSGIFPLCNGFVTIENATDVRLSGNGIIEGGGAAIRDRIEGTRLLLIKSSKNVIVSDIILQNPSFWNTHILGSEDVEIKRVKLLNDMKIKNTDGFDPDCSHNVRISNCFGHCSDDPVAIKSTGHCGLLRDVENVEISNCVFATKKSALKIGTETKAANMHNIRFLENDIIECDRGISLYVADGTDLHDVLYKGNRFEKNYADTLMMPFHFYARKRTPQSKAGHIHDVKIVKNVYETSFPCIPVSECKDGGTIEVELRDNVIAGKKINKNYKINLTTSKIIIL